MTTQTFAQLYASYIALCEKHECIPVKKNKFGNKDALQKAIDALGDNDENDENAENAENAGTGEKPATTEQLPAAATSPSTEFVTINRALTKVQRGLLRRAYTARNLPRPQGWRGASIPADLAGKIGL